MFQQDSWEKNIVPSCCIIFLHRAFRFLAIVPFTKHIFLLKAFLRQDNLLFGTDAPQTSSIFTFISLASLYLFSCRRTFADFPIQVENRCISENYYHGYLATPPGQSFILAGFTLSLPRSAPCGTEQTTIDTGCDPALPRNCWSSSILQPLQNYNLLKFALIGPSTFNHDRNLWNFRRAPDETTCFAGFFRCPSALIWCLMFVPINSLSLSTMF